MLMAVVRVTVVDTVTGVITFMLVAAAMVIHVITIVDMVTIKVTEMGVVMLA